MVFEMGPDGWLTQWERVEDIATLEDVFQAVVVGLSVQKRGELA
jgi:hypothetical protein